MTGRLQTPGKPCAKDFRTRPYGTGDGRLLEAEDVPVYGNGVEDGIAVEMAVEMGARKRIKGEGSLRGAPSDVPERFREASGTAFSGGSKKNGGEKGRNAWIDCGQCGNMRFFDGV